MAARRFEDGVRQCLARLIQMQVQASMRASLKHDNAEIVRMSHHAEALTEAIQQIEKDHGIRGDRGA